MIQEPDSAELLPLNTIRIETFLSRFPIHRLSKRGQIDIEINERNETGDVKTKWEVSYNSKHGQPGALAYKLDTLIINRKIDEARPLIPKIIKLGSLRDIADCLDLGGDTNKIKKALHQNAGAYITAKRKYKATNGAEKTFEAAFTRYSLIFTGEKLPNGTRADAVYLILNDVYMKVLNDVPTRPLNYDYLKDLSPGAQRFYELLSFQIYAALKHERPRAKLLYSYYCNHAPQTRYLDYDHVKKQMYKLHAPHKKSEYISAVEFRETTDGEGQPDWEMLYVPGRKARADFRASKRALRTIDAGPSTRAARRSEQLELLAAGDLQVAAQISPELESLVSKLISFKVSEQKARELVKAKPEAVKLHLLAIPYLPAGQGQKNFAGRLVKAIENDYELPRGLVEALENERQAKESSEGAARAKACPYCQELHGFRYVKGRSGPVRRCTHNPVKEAAYPES